ncbi:MAG: signal peptidase I [Gammaproteobacteria bacterium]|nr:signal peptidase I [Gammaproteobacteria bacterium]
MNFDFPLILVLASFITGALWALDALLWARKRQSGAKEPVLVEYAKAFFPVIFIVLLLRSFLVEPFRIPSGSMMPTLLVGDFILVNKYAYGLRLPVLNKKVLELGEPQRGDVVVFRNPQDTSVDYIKRVVAVPGDRVAYRGKILYINGVAMPQTPIGSYVGVGSGVSSSGADLREENLDGVRHSILIRPDAGGAEGDTVVPDGHYFMMGDNRDNSKDSRYIGPVPEGNLVGKAFMIWMNWDGAGSGVDWKRLGQTIH